MSPRHGMLRDFLESYQIQVPTTFFPAIDQLYDLLVSANLRLNLTRIVDYPDFLYKHVADSLLAQLIAPELNLSALECADLGCGAGFPGIPLALANPNLAMTEMDSVGKKIDAVAEFQAALGLKACSAVKGRARELSNTPEFRHRYHIVLARAVSDTPKLIRECRHLLRDEPGATLIAYKTPGQVDEETDSVVRDAEKAGLAVTRSDCYTLPKHAGTRVFWILKRKA